MKNAINNQFKMKMGSKQKDTEGAFSEKDTSLMKQAPLLSIASVLADDPEFLDPEAEHQHDLTVTSVGIEVDGDLDLDRLNDWLGNLLQTKGTDIFRSKGILSVAGMEERYVFQGVHMLIDGQPNGTWGDDVRRNRLVFIGRNLDRESLEASFRSCLV